MTTYVLETGAPIPDELAQLIEDAKGIHPKPVRMRIPQELLNGSAYKKDFQDQVEKGDIMLV